MSVWIWACFLQDMSFLGVQGMCSEERLKERLKERLRERIVLKECIGMIGDLKYLVPSGIEP